MQICDKTKILVPSHDKSENRSPYEKRDVGERRPPKRDESLPNQPRDVTDDHVQPQHSSIPNPHATRVSPSRLDTASELEGEDAHLSHEM